MSNAYNNIEDDAVVQGRKTKTISTQTTYTPVSQPIQQTVIGPACPPEWQLNDMFGTLAKVRGITMQPNDFVSL